MATESPLSNKRPHVPQLRPITAKIKYFKKEKSSVLKSFKDNFEAFERLIVRVVLSEQKKDRIRQIIWWFVSLSFMISKSINNDIK